MKKPYCPRRVEHWCDEAEHASRPVFGLDIDGTLGKYHEHFFRFAEGYLGRTIDPLYLGSPMHKHIGVSKTTYRQVKLAYRRGGLKRSMPVYPGAAELAASLRKRGAVVVICTTRPYLQLDNVEPDTREWLRRNRIQYDGIISGEHKYHDLAHSKKERIVAVLDDLPEMVMQANGLGIDAVLRCQPYNTPTNWPVMASDLNSASLVLHAKLDQWEEKYR